MASPSTEHRWRFSICSYHDDNDDVLRVGWGMGAITHARVLPFLFRDSTVHILRTYVLSTSTGTQYSEQTYGTSGTRLLYGTASLTLSHQHEHVFMGMNG